MSGMYTAVRKWGLLLVAGAFLSFAGAGITRAAAQSDPLPRPDFSMAYRHVFLAFAFAWILMLAYGVWIRRRMREMEREVERLGG